MIPLQCLQNNPCGWPFASQPAPGFLTLPEFSVEYQGVDRTFAQRGYPNLIMSGGCPKGATWYSRVVVSTTITYNGGSGTYLNSSGVPVDYTVPGGTVSGGGSYSIATGCPNPVGVYTPNPSGSTDGFPFFTANTPTAACQTIGNPWIPDSVDDAFDGSFGRNLRNPYAIVPFSRTAISDTSFTASGSASAVAESNQGDQFDVTVSYTITWTLTDPVPTSESDEWHTSACDEDGGTSGTPGRCNTEESVVSGSLFMPDSNASTMEDTSFCEYRSWNTAGCTVYSEGSFRLCVSDPCSLLAGTQFRAVWKKRTACATDGAYFVSDYTLGEWEPAGVSDWQTLTYPLGDGAVCGEWLPAPQNRNYQTTLDYFEFENEVTE